MRRRVTATDATLGQTIQWQDGRVVHVASVAMDLDAHDIIGDHAAAGTGTTLDLEGLVCAPLGWVGRWQTIESGEPANQGDRTIYLRGMHCYVTPHRIRCTPDELEVECTVDWSACSGEPDIEVAVWSTRIRHGGIFVATCDHLSERDAERLRAQHAPPHAPRSAR